MKASVVDLRYKMNDILKALERNENVTVLYHGKVKGILKPVRNKVRTNITEHPFFGMLKTSEKETVTDELERIRKSRYDF